MTGVDLGHLGADALGHVLQHALVEGLVLAGDDCPAWLGAPGGIFQLDTEGGQVNWHLGVFQESSVRIGHVSRKARLERTGLQETVAIGSRLDHELRRCRVALILLRGRFDYIRRRSGDVDQASDLGDDAGFRNHNATPGVADENGRAVLASKLPLAKDIEDFDLTGTPVNEGLVRQLAAGSFLAEQHNIVLVGGTGTGKSHLSIALARALFRNGARGRFNNVVDLVNGSRKRRATASRDGSPTSSLGSTSS